MTSCKYILLTNTTIFKHLIPKFVFTILIVLSAQLKKYITFAREYNNE